MLIGISLDEAHRMKPARQAYLVNCWPLVEQEVTRKDCLDWLQANGYPRPPKSACIGCPFRPSHEWRVMRDHQPDEWADAVAADRELRGPADAGLPMENDRWEIAAPAAAKSAAARHPRGPSLSAPEWRMCE